MCAHVYIITHQGRSGIGRCGKIKLPQNPVRPTKGLTRRKKVERQLIHSFQLPNPTPAANPSRRPWESRHFQKSISLISNNLTSPQPVHPGASKVSYNCNTPQGRRPPPGHPRRKAHSHFRRQPRPRLALAITNDEEIHHGHEGSDKSEPRKREKNRPGPAPKRAKRASHSTSSSTGS